jgi:hypothetical protein
MYKCEVCDAVLPAKSWPVAREWDWFCGYLPRTVHFCPQHVDSDKRNELFRLSQIAPKVVIKKKCSACNGIGYVTMEPEQSTSSEAEHVRDSKKI